MAGKFTAYRPLIAQNVAIGAASVESATIETDLVRVVATSDCYIAIGKNPDATGGTQLTAGLPEYFACSGSDKVAVIQVAAGGNLNITPMSA